MVRLYKLLLSCDKDSWIIKRGEKKEKNDKRMDVIFLVRNQKCKIISSVDMPRLHVVKGIFLMLHWSLYDWKFTFRERDANHHLQS